MGTGIAGGGNVVGGVGDEDVTTQRQAAAAAREGGMKWAQRSLEEGTLLAALEMNTLPISGRRGGDDGWDGGNVGDWERWY